MFLIYEQVDKMLISYSTINGSRFAQQNEYTKTVKIKQQKFNFTFLYTYNTTSHKTLDLKQHPRYIHTTLLSHIKTDQPVYKQLHTQSLTTHNIYKNHRKIHKIDMPTNQLSNKRKRPSIIAQRTLRDSTKCTSSLLPIPFPVPFLKETLILLYG